MAQLAPFSSSRSRAIFGVVVAFTITSTTSLILRLIRKRARRTKPTLEDWLIFTAQLTVYALATLLILDVLFGNAGHHIYRAPSQATFTIKLFIAILVLYATSLGLIKITICLFYSRIFVSRPLQLASIVVIVLICVWTIAAILSSCLTCRPLMSLWSQPIAQGSCVKNLVTSQKVIGALDVGLDLTVVILPLPFLGRFQFPMAKRIAIICIFGVGICTIATGILRIVALSNVDFSDVTYTETYILIWSFAKPTMSVSIACALPGPSNSRWAQQQSDIELQPYSTRFRRIREETLESELQAFKGSQSRRVGKGVGRHGSYMFTQVLESGHWSAASQHDNFQS